MSQKESRVPKEGALFVHKTIVSRERCAAFRKD